MSLETVADRMRLSRRAAEMQASPLRKLAALAERRKRSGIKVYHLNIGQPDLPTSPAVFEAIRSFSERTIAYAPSNGIPQALKAWKAYFQHHGLSFEEKELIVTAGGSEAIIFAMSAVCDAGDEVLVFEPFYTNYNGFATLANVRLRAIPLTINNGFHLPSADVIASYVTSRTRAILFCNPSNPTGTVYSREEVQRIVDVALKHDLFIISDEVYREFAYEGEAVSIMSFADVFDRAIVVDSCSKRFNVCGARIGVLASHNEEVVQTALKFGMARLSVATVEQAAVSPLLHDPTPYVTPLVEEFRKRRDLVHAGLATIPGVTCYKPEGAFYIVIGLPVTNADDFARWLIEEYSLEGETVLLAPAAGFYSTPDKGRNEVRLAFMLKGEDLQRSLTILRSSLPAYAKAHH